MKLVPITAEDEALTVRLECDPEMTRHLGGPRPEADVCGVATVAAGQGVGTPMNMKLDQTWFWSCVYRHGLIDDDINWANWYCVFSMLPEGDLVGGLVV